MTARVDTNVSYNPDGFEIHVTNPSGADVGIVSGQMGWVGRHGFADNVRPPGIPGDVINQVNGLNLEELRRRGIVEPKGAPTNNSGGRYLAAGRTLFDAVGVALPLLGELAARVNLARRACKNGLTPAQQFYRDSAAAGHPDFYMTPVGPMPNPFAGGRNEPMGVF